MEIVVTNSHGREKSYLAQMGYELFGALGEGSYAKVRKARSFKLKKCVAIKIIDKVDAPKDFIQKFLPRELSIMTTINHHNIIRLYEVIHAEDKIFIIMEYASKNDLLDYIKAKGQVHESQGRDFFRQILDGLRYLHAKNIAHRDLKCENILLSNDLIPKISDFGFARDFEPNKLSTTYCGSAAYASPEVLLGIPYNPTLYDIWSLGVILFVMQCSSMPFNDDNIRFMIKQQQSRNINWPQKKVLSLQLCELIKMMLEPEVSKRICLADIYKQAWLVGKKKKSSQTTVAHVSKVLKSFRK